MGRLSWLLIGLAVLAFLTMARVHHLPGGPWGETISIEFVPPWR
jgi:hypothetical protein